MYNAITSAIDALGPDYCLKAVNKQLAQDAYRKKYSKRKRQTEKALKARVAELESQVDELTTPDEDDDAPQEDQPVTHG
jgi:hypothetical protein